MGIFKNYETLCGSKRLYYTKTKIINDILPVLSDQFDTDIKYNNNPLPSFIVAKNMHNNYINMLKDKEETKKEVDNKYQQLIIKMRGAESLKGAGLDSARLNILAPLKLLLAVQISKSPRICLQ